jgi:nicotinamidase-related amidase
LVDYQNEFLTGKLPIGGAAKAVGQAVVLRDWARQSGIAVVYVKNVAAKADAPLFAPGSRNTEIAAELSPADGEEVIIKSMAGAFSGTDLNVKLRAKGIRTIIVGGIMTHLAVDTSARDGTVLGYRVIVASDACATRALHGIEGDEVVDDRTVHSVALAALADRFADVMPVGRIVRLGVKGGEVGK